MRSRPRHRSTGSWSWSLFANNDLEAEALEANRSGSALSKRRKGFCYASYEESLKSAEGRSLQQKKKFMYWTEFLSHITGPKGGCKSREYAEQEWELAANDPHVRRCTDKTGVLMCQA